MILIDVESEHTLLCHFTTIKVPRKEHFTWHKKEFFYSARGGKLSIYGIQQGYSYGEWTNRWRMLKTIGN